MIQPAAHPGPEHEVVDLCRELIRIDTTNTGDPETTTPERPAAEWVATRLAEVGIEAQLRESAPGRTSVVARIEGTDPGRRSTPSAGTRGWPARPG